MTFVPIEKMIERNPSLYKLVLLAAERANQIADGAAPLVEFTGKKKATTIALEEIKAGKIYYK